MACVLVVDDDVGIRESAAMALEKVGHRTLQAGDAASAQQLLREHRVDVVVSDIYMPGEDGLALLQSVSERRDPPRVILMTARGTITAGGAPPVSFTGTAWLDHQWGNFAGDPSALNWDWFSCRFDDRTELMLYRFRDRDGTPLITARNVTYVLRNGHSMTASTSFILPATESALEAAGHRWPLGWKLLVPSLGLAETVSAIVPDQLFRGTLVPTFYEGAATASGNENGQLKTGTCFVEETYG